MNAPGDYDGVDMGGLRRPWYESEVPVDAQRRLIAAFPELRMLWNSKLHLYQIVHRQPGHREGFYGPDGVGMLVNWSIIPGNYTKPLNIDDVIAQLRAREEVAIHRCREQGFENVAAMADDIYDRMVAQQKNQARAKMLEYFGINPDTGAVGTFHPFQARSKPFSLVSRIGDLPLREGAKK